MKQLTNLKQVRVRDIQGCAKIEVDKEKISIFDEKIINQLNEKLKIIGFTFICKYHIPRMIRLGG